MARSETRPVPDLIPPSFRAAIHRGGHAIVRCGDSHDLARAWRKLMYLKVVARRLSKTSPTFYVQSPRPVPA